MQREGAWVPRGDFSPTHRPVNFDRQLATAVAAGLRLPRLACGLLLDEEPLRPGPARQMPTRKGQRVRRERSPVGAAGKSFLKTSPWIRVQAEVHQAHELRLPLIQRLEQHYDAKVYTFFTSFTNEQSQITDKDAEMLESVLAVEHQGERLLLVLSSPGGDALAAERIVNVCRSYSEGKFEVLVPHMAKSAATMICFGASTIHMSRTSELGPVDPQVPYQDDLGATRWISAQEYVRSYDKLVGRASGGGPKRIEPYLQQLNRYDARFIEGLLSAQRLSEDISVRLLRSGMLNGQSEKRIRQAIDFFLRQERTSSHGRMINLEGVRQCRLRVEEIDLRSEVWETVWELYVRYDWAVSNVATKVIESAKSSVHVAAPRVS